MNQEPDRYLELASDNFYMSGIRAIRLVRCDGVWTQMLAIDEKPENSLLLDEDLLEKFRSETFVFAGLFRDEQDDTETLRVLFSLAAARAQILIGTNQDRAADNPQSLAPILALKRLHLWLLKALTERLKTDHSVDLSDHLATRIDRIHRRVRD